MWPIESLCHYRWPGVTFEGHSRYYKRFHCLCLENTAHIIHKVRCYTRANISTVVFDMGLCWARPVSDSLLLLLHFPWGQWARPAHTVCVRETVGLLWCKTPDFTAPDLRPGLPPVPAPVLYITGYGESCTNAFIRNSKGRQTSSMSWLTRVPFHKVQ